MSIFGFNIESSSGSDFLPIVKFDAKAGRMFRIDRVDEGQGFVNKPIDITGDQFKALVDFENMETGWIAFVPGSPPSFQMVAMDKALPAKPSEQHKNGIRMMLKLAREIAAEKPIRELAATAKSFLQSIAPVYLEWKAQRAQHPGMLPVIQMYGMPVPVKTGSGARSSTNYHPKFVIVGWAPRGDLVFVPAHERGGKPTNGAATGFEQTPPATGATKAEPPKQQEAPKQAFSASDFG